MSTETKENGSVPENTSGSDDSLPAPIAEPPCNPKQNGEEDIQELQGCLGLTFNSIHCMVATRLLQAL